MNVIDYSIMFQCISRLEYACISSPVGLQCAFVYLFIPSVDFRFILTHINIILSIFLMRRVW